MKNRKIKTKLIPGKAFHEVLIGSETFNYDVIDNTLPKKSQESPFLQVGDELSLFH